MRGVLFIFICLLSLGARGQDKERLLIAAASDLKFALDSVIVVYKALYPDVTVSVSYGSSGKLAEQISNGAPFDIFFSADAAYPRKLSENSLCAPGIHRYGFGRLVLWSNIPDAAEKGLSLLDDARIRKIAIANPLHAPYGKAALDVLRSTKHYDQVREKLVYGENISQAAHFVTTGAADAGIIALALAMSPHMKKTGGSFYVIPDDLHAPLEQVFVVMKRSAGRSAVMNFARFVSGTQAKDILTYFGFSNQP